MDYRNYDPALGRMNQVDPLAGKYASMTPYNYAFNDPVYWNDASGAEPNYYREEAMQRRAATINVEDFSRNNFAWLYRGGNMNSMFNTGWSPWTNSMSASAFAGADVFFGQKSAEAVASATFGITYIEAGATYTSQAYSTTNYDYEGSLLWGNDAGTKFSERGMSQSQVNIWLASSNPMNNAPSGLDGYIPVWGSGKQAAYWFDQGDLSRGMMYSALAISDVFLVKAAVTAVARVSFSAAVKQAPRVFWTGGKTEGLRAMAFAKANGMATLEMTKTGKILYGLTNLTSYNTTRPLWDMASKRFALGASESATVFMNVGRVSPTSTFFRIEYPILRDNADLFFHIN